MGREGGRRERSFQMRAEPIIMPPPAGRRDASEGIEARGKTLVIGEWGGAGVGEVAPLHVHHADDEGMARYLRALRFRFSDREVLAEVGSTVFAPAGVAHTFGSAGPGALRYLIVTTSRLNDLVEELHQIDRAEHPAVFRKYNSELLE